MKILSCFRKQGLG